MKEDSHKHESSGKNQFVRGTGEYMRIRKESIIFDSANQQNSKMNKGGKKD
jgi:hypothetical protein